MAIAVIILLFFGIVFQFFQATTFFIYAIYVFIAIYGLLTTSQFWLLTKASYGVREAKRCYGFIGAGGIAGGIFGGYLTSLLTRIMPVENIIFVAVLLLLICFPLYRIACKQDLELIHKPAKAEQEKDQNPFRMILNSDILFFNAFIVFFSVIAAKLIDFQYRDLASHFTDNKQDLGAFFGIWLSNISIISLVIQLFFTKKILKRLGVTNSLLLMPGGLFLASIIFVVVPELWVAVLMKMIDGSMKQSINKSASELVYMPIPIETSRATKSYIDVVVDSVATGVAGFLLYFILKRIPLSTNFISIVVVLVIAIWVYFITKLKVAYRNEFKQLAGITSTSNSDGESEKEVSNPEETIASIIRVGNTSQMNYMLNQLIQFQPNAYFDQVLPLLGNSDSNIQSQTIAYLSQDESTNYTDEIMPLLRNENIYVAADAFNYVSDHLKAEEKKELFHEYLQMPISTQYMAALVALSNDIGFNKKSLKKQNFEQYVDDLIDFWNETDQQELARTALGTIVYCAGNNGIKKYSHFIDEQIQSEDNEIAELAMMAASKVGDLDQLQSICNRLFSADSRPMALQAIKNYGDEVVNTLVDFLTNRRVNPNSAPFVVEAIGRVQPHKAVPALFQIASLPDFPVAIQAIQELNQLKEKQIKLKKRKIYHLLDLYASQYKENVQNVHSLNQMNEFTDKKLPNREHIIEARTGLIQQMTHQYNRPKTILISLLTLLYEKENIEQVASLLSEGRADQKMNASEYIVELFDQHSRDVIVPIIDAQLQQSIDHPVESEFKFFNLENLNEKECITQLLLRNDIQVIHSVLYLVGQINNPDYLSLVSNYLDHSKLEVRKQAQEVYDQLQSI